MSEIIIPKKGDTTAFVSRAKKIYTERYQDKFEKLYRDKYVAIEPDSGDYFIGDSKMEAALRAKEKHPEKFFHFILVGHKGVYKRR